MLAPAAACAVILSHFCIPAQYAAVSEVGGFVHKVDERGRPVRADPDEVRRLGVSIVDVVEDHFRPTGATELRESCVGDVCVVHRVRCDETGQSCSYEIAQAVQDRYASSVTLSTYVIHASSPAQRREVERAIRLRLRSGRGYRLIPLLALERSHPAPADSYSATANSLWPKPRWTHD